MRLCSCRTCELAGLRDLQAGRCALAQATGAGWIPRRLRERALRVASRVG